MAEIIIAVRGGPTAKSRLAGSLSGADRAGLVVAMLSDMLSAITRVDRGHRVWVVTPTPDIVAVAEAAGARVLFEPTPTSLNLAFVRGLAEVGDVAPYGVIALLPGDLPMLEPTEVEAALLLTLTHDLVLAPALTDGGTGGLFLPPGRRFTPRFGTDSFQRHIDDAQKAGLSCAVVNAASLGHDIDRPEDLSRLRRQAPEGATGALLTALAKRRRA